MNIIIDLDLQQAVQSFGSTVPLDSVQVKSQDTPTLAVYFTRKNVNYDLGTSPGLRFGVFIPGNPNPLVQQNTFTRTIDNLSRAVYVAYPNFNTVPMQAALGSQPQLSCIGEIRYQTSYGTIARTADIDFTVIRPLLTETVMDNLIAVFVTPAVNANATARISNTGWLSAGLNISIGAGAGAYQVVSVTNLTDFVAKNLGAAGNAASGTSIPIGTAVGIAPVNVLQAYPDPSIIEVTTHKDIINGYAGLDGTGLLKGTEMPVDGTTIAVSGGKLTVVGGGGTAGQNAYTLTSASFVVPAVGATVSVAVASTAWMGGTGYVVFITGAGYYTVNSITDATHVVLSNGGGASNAIVGTTVPSGATVAAAGPVGAAGAAGAPGAALSAYDALASPFVMPAAAANVTITIANTAWLGVGQVIYIASAGYFQVASISSATQAAITNLNYPGNASAGATIASGSKVSAGGLIGATGSGGAGKNAFTNLATNFTQPAVNSTASINVGSTAWMAVGQVIFVQGGGYYTVSSITDLTDAVVTNLGYAGNAAPGATVTSGSTVAVTPGGLAGQAGRDAFTLTTASFTIPTSGATVTVTVGATAWMAQGQILYIPTAGYFSVSVITDATHVVLTNLGYTGNASAGTVISSGSSVVAAGIQGPAGTGGGGGGTLTDATTATGFSWISNPAGILKRVVAGSANITIADSGSVLTVDAPGAGGGGGMIARTTGIELFDDFVGYCTSSVTTPSGALGWLVSSISGSSINNFSVLSGPEIGVWSFNPPTSGTNIAQLVVGSTAAAFAIAAAGQGVLIAEWRVKVNGTLETISNYADHRFGINGTNIGGANWAAAYFQYNVSVGTNWQCVSYNGTTAISADSGVAVSAAAYQKLTITMNAAWTTATFAINGVTCATLTGVNWGSAGWSPTATAKFGAGAPINILMDWFYAKYTVSR